tara:strand:- start:195 stop:626 length:432 start_codon:yes stop_codon:yes gene_type:complete
MKTFWHIGAATVILSLFFPGCHFKKVPEQTKVAEQPKLAEICIEERALADKATHENIGYLVILDTKANQKNNQTSADIEHQFRLFGKEDLNKILFNFDSLVEYINCLHRAYRTEREEYDFEQVNIDATEIYYPLPPEDDSKAK